ncbi:efflux transporter outer membrane subunit [Gallaecimonas mangrovi]|uniref:efflux transporter outer membrane subunit n=1 Tax=Gallaecimonas mangrovi TaxID=2291597 RepID=UPI001D017A56|nr:efflux transporter outer membrane subunit [Gallaecimonas mangrovi]
MNKVKPVLTAITLALALGGCARSDYHRPDVATPNNWSAPLTGKAYAANNKWWQSFGDPKLDALIEKVLQSNNDLAVAALKVKAARLNAGLTNTNLTPDVSAGIDASKSKDLKHGTSSDASYSSTLSLSYEVDLWGHLSSARDAAEWEAIATEYDRQESALALVGTTADLYWELGYLNQAIADGKASIEYVKKTLALVEIRYKAGSVSRLELLEARQAVASQESDLASLEQQRAEDRSALAILFNHGPETKEAEPQTLPDQALPAVPAGLPAQLLARRPDLQAAEWRLKESLADVDETRDSFLPTLTLTGSLGTSSDALKNVLENPIGTLGAGLTLPFLEWNTRKYTIKVSENAYQQAVVNFRQSIYSAFKDVEDALSARDNYLRQGKALERYYQAAKEAESIAKVRYENGATDVQDFLDQQQARRTAELSVVQNRYNQLSNLMTLYQALGGGAEKTLGPTASTH